MDTWAPNKNMPHFLTACQKPKFHVGDKVYLMASGSREGPYIVGSIPSAGKCTLCLEDGRAVKDNNEIDATYVEAV